MSIKVFGHKSPDIDTVCSSIAYAWYLSKKRSKSAKPYILGDINKETELLLKKFSINLPATLSSISAGEDVVVIDTNNKEELVEGIDQANIIEIIDHHKLFGNLSTDTPIKVTIRPLACTATILWKIFKDEGNEDIDKSIAGIMLGAILSDTLKFTSPTTTEEDKKAAEELATIAGVEIEKQAEEQFRAKSDISSYSPKELLLLDSKIFELASKKIRVSVLETTLPRNAMKQKKELLLSMNELKKEEALDGMFFFAVDILKSEATLLIPGPKEKEIAEKAFGVKLTDAQALLPGVVSRKKQIIPEIERVL